MKSLLYPGILAGLALAGAAHAALDVLPPQTIQSVVEIQPIIVEKTTGEVAEFLGSSAAEAYIKGQIDAAWAQVGIDIEWLAPVSYVNDFAYDGSPGDYSSSTRPKDSHLNQILNSAGTPPKSANASVVNLFFIEIVPGFPQLTDWSANGIARIDSNGSTIHVGRNLVGIPGWEDGMDVVAAVIAHEIGHCLGLSHTSSLDNLLYQNDSRTSDYLTTGQQTTIYTNNSGIDGFDFLQALPSPTQYDLWAAANGVSGGPTDDDDLDRLNNGFEFLYGSSPTSWTHFPSPTLTAAGPVWSFPRVADALADGFDYLPESSFDLATWLPAGVSGSGSTVLTDSSSLLSVRLDSGTAGAFLRIDLQLPPAATSGSFIPAALLAPDPTPPVISACSPETCGHGHAVPPAAPPATDD